MDLHQRLSAWLHIGSAVLVFLLLGLVTTFLTVFFAWFDIPTEAQVLFGAIASVVFGAVGLVALVELLGGIGALAGWAIGRPLLYVSSALQLLNIPIGTALGLYTFWAYLRDPQPAITVVASR